MIWFTSDLHFNHRRILEYESKTRPFSSIKEMNETLIQNWNSVVKKEDEVYVLGDFIMGEPNSVENILNRLNGQITLIRGNHDTKSKLAEYRRLGIEVKDIEYISYKGRFFILNHFPMTNPEFIEMVRRDNSEVIMLYGHLHSNADKGYVDGTYHIGVDTNNLTPISIEQIWQESWPEEMMTEEIAEYKRIHDLHPDLEQIARGAPVGNPAAGPTFPAAAATFDLNALQRGYDSIQNNVEFHSEIEKNIINNIYKNLIKGEK